MIISSNFVASVELLDLVYLPAEALPLESNSCNSLLVFGCLEVLAKKKVNKAGKSIGKFKYVNILLMLGDMNHSIG